MLIDNYRYIVCNVCTIATGPYIPSDLGAQHTMHCHAGPGSCLGGCLGALCGGLAALSQARDGLQGADSITGCEKGPLSRFQITGSCHDGL